MHRIVTHYRDDAALRASFNALARETFGLDFEGWYQNGFWGDAYEPYSVVEDGRVVANVSVSRTDLMVDGRRRKLYQLGTVMTAPEYRSRGYIRQIMERIDADLTDAEGVYLFANDSVLEFYPKFGFVRGQETVWTKTLTPGEETCLQNVPMEGPEQWDRLARAMAESRVQLGCQMVENPGLYFFYVSQFMRGCAWFHQETGTWVLAEREDDKLTLHGVFSQTEVTLEQVLGWFGGVTEVTLGFTPDRTEGFVCRELKEEDCTFFVRGPIFAEFREKQLRIPALAHA